MLGYVRKVLLFFFLTDALHTVATNYPMMAVTSPTLTLLLFATCCVTSSTADNSTCGKQKVSYVEGTGGLSPVLDRGQAALLLLLGFGGFSVLLAFLYISIRRHVFRDADNLNTTFDAGGRVSVSLTAVTVASQLLWPGDLLQSATVTIKNGVAGSFWYSSAAVINMILFPMLSVQFKTRAPGAKTFLQVIYARFGLVTHVVFCCFALLLNLVVFITLMAASTALLQSLIKNASEEFCVLIMATLFGSYSFVGGLGSTFYVSYFNAAIIFCLLATFIFQGFFATASITFCDQASWQSRIAAKPVQGVLGFFAATYIWFAIPSTIGTSVGVAYLDFSATNATNALSEADIDAGLVTAFMAQTVLGEVGSYMVLTMLIMALMSTGSGEVMAVSSIIVYDMYQTHIRPFRRLSAPGHCVLCGLAKPSEVEEVSDTCSCVPAAECQQCTDDMERIRTNLGPSRQRIYRCWTHGEYRHYQDSLMDLKSWVILWVTVGLVPLGLVVIASGIDLNWVMMCGFILTVPCFPGALMTIIWVKTTSIAMIIGSLSGLVGGLAANLITAATFEGGLSDFLRNTSENYPVLAGSSTAFGLSLILTFVISLFTHKVRTPDDEKVEWQRLRDIDNPLYPWVDTYEFPKVKGSAVMPSYEELDTMFRSAKLLAYIGGAVSIVLFIIVIPGVMASLHVMSDTQFQVWVTSLQVWCFLMALVVILVAPVEEIITIARQIL
nr:hypothetical protein BaRGS_016815 [Batillaria attramentaria]